MTQGGFKLYPRRTRCRQVLWSLGRRSAWLLPAALLALSPGCKLGPDYQRPEVATPDSWRWKIAEPSDDVPRGEWWKVFEEPVLDQLQEEAAAGNLELQ